MKHSNLLRLSSLFAVLAMLGCFETEKDPRVAGGDDYPNGVEPLGKKAAQARADSTDWNGFDSVPKSGPGLYDTVTVPDTVPDTSRAGDGTPAPKRTASAYRNAPDTTLPGGLGGPGLPADTGLAGGLPKDTLVPGGKPADTLAGVTPPKDSLVPGGKPSDTLAGVTPPKDTLAKVSPPQDTTAKGSVADTCTPGGLLGKVCPLDTLVTKVIDTAKGTVAAIRTQVNDSGTTRKDSTVIVKPDPAKPGSTGGVSQVVRSVVSKDSSRIDIWKFLDADGNGVLKPQAGMVNKVAIEASVTLPGGVLQKKTQVLAAGADLDFNARGDNKLVAAATVTLLGSDTIDIIKFLDADGDSVLIDFTKDSNLVDLIEVRNFPAGSALVSVTRQVRIVASKDSSKNYPIRFSERKVFKDGSLLDIAARGLGPDSAFRAGMEARWTETLFPPSSDSLERKVRAFRVRLWPVPGAFAGNVLLGWSVEETRRSAHGHFGMDFICETPVADGRWSATGDVIAWLVQADGRLTFTGVATAAGMKGQVTGPDGEGAAITFDLAGAIVSPRP